MPVTFTCIGRLTASVEVNDPQCIIHWSRPETVLKHRFLGPPESQTDHGRMLRVTVPGLYS